MVRSNWRSITSWLVFVGVLAGCAEGSVEGPKPGGDPFDAGPIEKDVTAAPEDVLTNPDRPKPPDGGGCARDEDCVGSDRARCDTRTRACVRCVTSAHCPAGNVCVNGVCATGCDAERPCGAGMACCAGACIDVQITPSHCGACGSACNATHGTPSCTAGRCAIVCDMGFADCDRDAANGCECRNTPTVDLPDENFVDSDGDGVDGTAARAIFVSTRGNDMAPGTREAPKRTVQAGVTAAAPVGFAVYIAGGTYAESVTLASGVSLYGGYNDTGWTRGTSNITTIQGGTTAVRGAGLGAAVELQFVYITAADATGAGESSYGVRVAGSAMGVTLRRCTITAGRGGDGQRGADGMAGSAGANASGPTPGTSPCGANGGAGGAAARGNNSGNPGGMGLSAMDGAAGGMGGTPGVRGGGCPSSMHATSAPDTAQPGTAGMAGMPGAGGSGSVRASDAAWVAHDGGNGTPGTHGGGGGGGGSGGGDRSGYPFCHDDTSGSGGAGGGGGCRGTGGTGGTGGGGSFAVMAHGTPLRVEDCQLTTHDGGAGGAGGAGGVGGAAGSGSPGGGGGGDSGNGARGREGGAGGGGGGGAGGSGGPSVCVYAIGSAPAQSGNTCMRGAGGMGGAGGAGAAPSGMAGVAADTHGG